MSEPKPLLFPAEFWKQDLRNGGHIVVVAHAYRVDGSDVVFFVFVEVEGRGVELETLRIPLDLFPDGYFE